MKNFNFVYKINKEKLSKRKKAHTEINGNNQNLY